MYKKIFILPILAVMSLFSAGQALAHATVKPAEVGIGKYQTFTLAIPSEKPVSTVSIRLVMPEGINSATPNVKSGWKIEKKTLATGIKVENEDGVMVDEQKLVEIIWTGGNIPTGMRDEFVFSIKVPSKPTTLNWKVYQTYADGSVVSWVLGPNEEQPKVVGGKTDFSAFGPYSMTKVIDDLSVSSTPVVASNSNSDSKIAIVLSVIAVGLALLALQRSKK